MANRDDAGKWSTNEHLAAWNSELTDQLAAELTHDEVDIVQAVRNTELTELYAACQGLREEVQRLRLNPTESVQEEVRDAGDFIRYAVAPLPACPTLLRVVVNKGESEPHDVLRRQVHLIDYIMYLASMTITRQAGVTPDNLDAYGRSDRHTAGMPPLLVPVESGGFYVSENFGYRYAMPDARIQEETPLQAIQQQRHTYHELAQILARFPGVR